MGESAILTHPALTLNGDLKELERLTAWVRQFRAEHGLEDDVEFRLNLAIEELFTNAVRHGGCKGVANAVTIALEREGPDVIVKYTDCGEAFDPADAPAADLESPLEERRAGGLGLHFVRQMAHRFEYHRWNSENRITMRLAI